MRVPRATSWADLNITRTINWGALARFHARVDGGPLLVGAEAFAAVWRAIPLTRPHGVLAGWPPLTRGLAWAYERFLIWRPWLQARCRPRDAA